MTNDSITRTRATEEELQERIGQIVLLRVRGFNQTEIVRFIASSPAHEWAHGLTRRHLTNYVKKADMELTQGISTQDRRQMKALANARAEHLFQKSLSFNNIQDALKSQQMLNQLNHLDDPIAPSLAEHAALNGIDDPERVQEAAVMIFEIAAAAPEQFTALYQNLIEVYDAIKTNQLASLND